MEKQTASCPNCGKDFEFDISENIEARIRFNLEQDLKDQKEKLGFRERNVEEKEKKVQDVIEEEVRKKLQAEREGIFNKAKADIERDYEDRLNKKDRENEEYVKKINTINAENDSLKAQSRKLENDKSDELRSQKEAFEKEKDSLRTKYREEAREGVQLELKQKELDNERTSKQLQEASGTIEMLKKQLQEAQENKSINILGEAHEIILEDKLRSWFPNDIVYPVKSGTRGADVIHEVKNEGGGASGKIIYESKYAKRFQNEWINKLKEDGRNERADIFILVTSVYPRDLEKLSYSQGVYICSLNELEALITSLRFALIKIERERVSNTNIIEKKHKLYTYLVGQDFKNILDSVKEIFDEMNKSIDADIKHYNKALAMRQKQLQRLKENVFKFVGDIKGIESSIPDFEDVDATPLELSN